MIIWFLNALWVLVVGCLSGYYNSDRGGREGIWLAMSWLLLIAIFFTSLMQRDEEGRQKRDERLKAEFITEMQQNGCTKTMQHGEFLQFDCNGAAYLFGQRP